RGQLRPDVGAVDGDLQVGDVLPLRVDVGRPGELIGGVPLVPLGLLVEVLQLEAGGLVAPGVVEVEGGGQAFPLLVLLGGRAKGGVSRGNVLLWAPRRPAPEGRAREARVRSSSPARCRSTAAPATSTRAA